MNINSQIFSGLQDQNGAMKALKDFLKSVPNGTRVHLPQETSVTLEHICSALPNMITAEIAEFNNANCGTEAVH